MNLRRELFSTHVFEPLFLPALIVGGLLISIVGGYVTITQRASSAEMVERSVEDERSTAPGERRSSERSGCRHDRGEAR